MAERLVGLETEYAFTALGRGGQVLGRAKEVARLIKLAKARLEHMRGYGDLDLFLANGSRLYVDCGLHPEFCTPECTNPWDAVRYVLAGERILGGLMEELAKEPEIAEAALFKCNVDYGGTGSTWGCHESYLHRMDPRLISAEIIPHLVSRVIYTGAGGFRGGSGGLEFTLSPRVGHMVREESGSSTHTRGIFHTKDESLSSEGYHRLHLLCGESLCSHMGMWLKVGTTALVVAMIEAGLRPGEGVRLGSPLSAMQTFACDPQCKATVPSTGGKGLTARMIQRHYLEQAEAHLGATFMPSWAKEVCHQWRAMLDRLAGAPQSVATSLDWAIKLAVFRDWAENNGVTWQSLPDWSHVHERIVASLGQTPYKTKSVTVEFVLGPQSPIGPEVEKLGPYLDAHGMKWDGLRPFVQLRPAMFEIDTRFGQIGPNGIFSAMDRQGVLDHAVSGVDNIEHAIGNPPAVGRAKIRGQWVRSLAGDNGQYVCAWTQVIDLQRHRMVDFTDPFTERADWRQMDKHFPGTDSPAMDLRLMELLQSRRRRRRPAESGPHAEYRPGQPVVIALIPSEAPRDLAGHAATVVSVDRDEEGVFYRLDADEGRYSWRTGHLRPAEGPVVSRT